MTTPLARNVTASRDSEAHWKWCSDTCLIPHRMIADVARSQVAKFNKDSHIVEPDDVSQEAWLAYWEQRHVVDTLIEAGELRQAWWLVRDRVYAYCRKQLTEQAHYVPSEQYFYARGTLKAFLPSVFAGDVSGETSAGLERPRKTSGPCTSGSDLDTMLADIRWGLTRLSPKDRETLFEHYSQSGDVYEPPKAKSALSRLQQVLGGQSA